MNKAFWKGKRVFLTGHTGFKGSWFCLLLNSLGAEVTGYALPAPTNPSLFEEAGIERDLVSVIGDVRDRDRLIESMKLVKPEIVFHLAAQPLVRRSYVDPYETYSTNVLGVVNLLDSVRQCDSVRAVVNVTTDKCYENKEWVWGYREDEPMGGHDPYSSSKGCAELVTSAYRRSFFEPKLGEHAKTAIATARAGNVIGGGDWAVDRLIPDIVRSLISSQEIVVRNPNSIRPWQHVLEPLLGYLTLAEGLFMYGTTFAEAWNFGPPDDDSQTVEWIVKHIIQSWGGGSWRIAEDRGPHEAHYLKLDSSKAHQRLGWKSALALPKALDSIVYWNKAHQSGVPARELCLQQINEYMATLAK